MGLDLSAWRPWACGALLASSVLGCSATAPNVTEAPDAQSFDTGSADARGDAPESVDAAADRDAHPHRDAGIALDSAVQLDTGIALDSAVQLDTGIALDAARVMVCEGPDAAVPPSPIVAPELAEYLAVLADLAPPATYSPTMFVIDPATCVGTTWETGLPLGSAFVHMARAESGDCQVWIGGEEENPEYNGLPRVYCRLPPTCAPIQVTVELAGPPSIDSPWCVSAGFCTDIYCPR